MKNIVFVILLFLNFTAICQTQHVFLIDKENGKVFKFNLPVKINIMLKNRYKVVGGERVYDQFKVTLVKVSNDSIFTLNAAQMPNRVIKWDSIEQIKFSQLNSKSAAILPIAIIPSLLFAATLFEPMLIIFPGVMYIAPTFLLFENSRRRFNTNEYLIVN